MSWFDRLTLSQRKLVASGVGVLWATFVIVMFGHCDGADPSDTRARAVAPPDDFESPSEPTTEPQASFEGEPNGIALTSERATQNARSVATRFVDAFATYSYTDDPDALVEHIEAYVTPSFAAEFALSSGAVAFHQELATRRARADVDVEGAQTQAVTGEAIEFLVIARRVVRSTEGRTVERPTYLVRVARTSDGWKVTGLTL